MISINLTSQWLCLHSIPRLTKSSNMTEEKNSAYVIEVVDFKYCKAIHYS